jgi:GT2 family glycosyltransferase
MISVLTLVHGRAHHLDNMLSGLVSGTDRPDEVVIVHMNERATLRQSDHFRIVTREISAGERLPLAAARNCAVAAASNENLIFLDVDCIPAGTLISEYRSGLSRRPAALHQGEVRYLPEHIDASTVAIGELEKAALYHPLHEYRSGRAELPYDLFWSLNFACTRSMFEAIGGFDTQYCGYGGEDTDFSYRAEQKAVPLMASPAVAFHQFHPTYDPPLNHLSDIVRNAEVFKKIWSKWPMQGWLDAFERRGFIRVHTDHIERKRLPTQKEIDDCLNSEKTGF